MVDRLTDEAQATGAVDTITRDGTKLVGHNTDVIGFRVALDKLVGNQKMPRAAVVLGAGGGARAAVYALIRENFQRVIVFNRHLHRAEALVRHFGRRASHMSSADAIHESVIEAEMAKRRYDQRPASVTGGTVSPIPGQLLPPDARPRPAIRARRDAEAGGGATTTRAAGRHVPVMTATELRTRRRPRASGAGKKVDLEMLAAKLDEVRGKADMPTEVAAATE